jgi:hypothetical protein
MTKLLYSTAALMLFTTGAMACEGCEPSFHSETSVSSSTSETQKNDTLQRTTPLIGNWVNAATMHTMLQGSGGGGATVQTVSTRSVPDNNCKTDKDNAY